MVKNAKLLISITLIMGSLILFSCEDIFHNTAGIINYLNEQNNIPEPKRIFIGGDLTYNIDGINREGFVVTNGQGNIDHGFFDNTATGIIINSPVGWKRGVSDIGITDDYIYVGGNFGGYDQDHSNLDGTDVNYHFAHRYNLSGSLDIAYTPFSGVSGNPEVYAIEPLTGATEESLVVGGNNITQYGYTELVRFTPDGTGSMTFPFATTGANYYSLEKVIDDSILMTFGETTDFSAIEWATSTQKQLTPSLSPTSVIWDVAGAGDSIYLVGQDSSGLLKKYNYDGTVFNEDSSFNSDFTVYLANNLADHPSATFNRINAVTTDKLGRIYIGGNFSEIFDETGRQHNSILRLTNNGIDPSFNTRITGEVFAIEIQENGKVLIGGQFADVNENSGFNGLVRVDDNGNIDWVFKENIGSSSINVMMAVYAIAIEE